MSPSDKTNNKPADTRGTSMIMELHMLSFLERQGQLQIGRTDWSNEFPGFGMPRSVIRTSEE